MYLPNNNITSVSYLNIDHELKVQLINEISA
jgi:hypothetical protein